MKPNVADYVVPWVPFHDDPSDIALRGSYCLACAIDEMECLRHEGFTAANPVRVSSAGDECKGRMMVQGPAESPFSKRVCLSEAK